AEGTRTTGSLVIDKAGEYRIGTRMGDELVALTDDHAIDLIADQKPAVEILKPARDWQASSIEEVPVRVRAEDDFRVRDVELRYSVNGGEWQSVPLRGGGKELSTDTLLRLEELGAASPGAGAETRLTPGDLVWYYAVARDRQQSVQTDLFLIQVQPFERRFTQAAGGGGMQGGAGADQSAISERQREILLATWNLQRTREESGARGAQRF